MTHDELLANINWQEESAIERCMYTEVYDALRAVVELHKPKGNFADTYIDGEPNNPYCPECIDSDFYPCPTIRAIEKELL